VGDGDDVGCRATVVVVGAAVVGGVLPGAGAVGGGDDEQTTTTTHDPLEADAEGMPTAKIRPTGAIQDQRKSRRYRGCPDSAGR
jgi:hypothetical protein